MPEEAIETTIGVVSALPVIRRAFLNRIQTFPTEINSGDQYQHMKKYLEDEYYIKEDEYAFGWLDLNLIKHANMLNRVSSLFVTGLDVLDGISEIKMCTKYKLGDKEVDGVLPATIDDFGKLTPEYKILQGWKTDITNIDKFDDLPVNCQSFLREVEKKSKCEISYISVNSEENEGMLRIVR